MKKLIVTIDGPGAAGKGTIAYLLARRYGLLDIDSGALFRAVTWLAMEHDLPIDEEHQSAIVALAAKQAIELIEVEGVTLKMGVTVNDRDISQAIRSEALGRVVPKVSVLPEVRAYVERQQHALAASAATGVVIEGRDTGTVVFPQAQVKIFLTASPEERAHRRHAELIERGKQVALEEVYADLVARDLADTERTLSPLTKPTDAVVIDSTNLRIDDVVDKIGSLVEAYLPKKA
jgi:cytidylate kinase